MLDTPTLAVLAAAVTLLLTFLLSTVEIQNGADSSLRATYNVKYFIFALIQLAGNGFATFFAWIYIVNLLIPEYKPWIALIAPFTGVFAFEGILTRTNIDIFDKKLLTFQDWVLRAKTPAVARAIAKNAQLAENEKVRIAKQLTEQCDPKRLKTYLFHPLPAAEQKRIENQAAKSTDPQMYLALELVSQDLNRALAFLKNHGSKS